MKTYRLRRFVNRVLLVRLALATGVIALVVGLIVYRIQQMQLEREVADLGRRGAAALVERVRDVMDLENELAEVVTKYFSAGLETLQYGKGT
jgi:hypothetical protein